LKTVNFTDFRKKASGFIAEVEHGETIIVLRHGKPVAEVVPYSDRAQKMPAWRRPGIRLKLSGSDLSSVILEERDSSV
jgi:prevent-host-death family protein